jgi:hypothetical protein
MCGVAKMINGLRDYLVAGLILCIVYITINPPSVCAEPGLLVVHPTNPRYFMVQGDPTQKAVYLAGAHTWAEFQTYLSETFDFTDWVSNLVSWNHNFMRGWTWEDDYYSPMPFNMSGDKYDLDSYNISFFNHYKNRVQEAADNNLYISVMLFQGWSMFNMWGLRFPNPWPHHPYKSSNNINGINGDPNDDFSGVECHELGYSSILDKQEAYVAHMIDELNNYDNIIWEIGNECHDGSIQWQYHMIDFIHSYEAAKPKQHLVWMNADPSDLFHPDCHAEVVSPNGNNYDTDPPVSTGQKIVISDSDHQGPLTVQHPWAWRNFTRGNLPILMDCKHQGLAWWTGPGFGPGHPKWQQMRNALGIIRSYTNRMDLASTIPQDHGTNPSSTGYCLYNNGVEYMVYQPNTIYFTVNLPAAIYDYEWIHPYNGFHSSGFFNWSGGNYSFTPPFDEDSVLYINKRKKPIAVIGANPTKGFPSLQVNFDGSNSYDPDGIVETYQCDFLHMKNILIMLHHSRLLTMRDIHIQQLRLYQWFIPWVTSIMM